MLPWEIHPSLQAHYLICIGDILRRARDSAARQAKRNLGDTNWAVGSVTYDRSRYGLAMAAKNEYADWLSVSVGDGHLLLRVKMVPLRFYKGDLEHPVPERYLDVRGVEAAELQTAFGAEWQPDEGGFFRLEVTTNEKAFTTGVNFVQVDGHGKRHHRWPIPKYVRNESGIPARRGAVALPSAAELAEVAIQSPLVRGEKA